MLPPEIAAAGRECKTAVIESWLRDGGNVNDRDENGNSLLHSVCECTIGHRIEPALRAVLSADPDVNARKRSDGRTALHVLIDNSPFSKPRSAALLLDKGAHIDARDDQGTTPLMLAAPQYIVDRDFLSLLLERGARVDLRDNHENDAESLAKAARSRRVDLDLEGLRSSYSDPERVDHLITLLEAIRAAGTWQKYKAEPRVSLIVLRALCEKGRAQAPASGLLSRLFPDNTPEDARTCLPADVFRHVLTYWQSNLMSISMPTTSAERRLQQDLTDSLARIEARNLRRALRAARI